MKTIIACSTGSSANVAISVLRISGQNFLDQVDKVFSINLSMLKTRYATYCKLIDGDSVVDDVVVTFFKGPNSYNGEDILEIACHGNRLNIERIINLFIDKCGLAHARPGEFTQRALKNKKLSLSQVEGLDLLLNANNIFSLKQGFSLMSGSLQKSFIELHDAYINHRSALEIGFDFIDDVGEESFKKNCQETLRVLIVIVEKLKNKVVNSKRGLIKPEVGIFGPPNAGKSTLFNRLLGEERAIVTSKAGTTRDYLSEELFVEGNYFYLIDTAGIRATSDEVESEGIKRSEGLLENTFFKILLLDPSNLEEISKFSLKEFDLCLLTHANEEGKLSAELLEWLNLSGPIEPKNIGPIEPVGIGPIGPIYWLDLLKHESKQLIFSEINKKYLQTLSFDPILIERHKRNILDIDQALANYVRVSNDINDLAVVASEFNTVGNCISELIGIVSTDQILGNIFDNFCIGK